MKEKEVKVENMPLPQRTSRFCHEIHAGAFGSFQAVFDTKPYDLLPLRRDVAQPQNLVSLPT